MKENKELQILKAQKTKLLNKEVKTMQEFIEIQNELLQIETELKNKKEEE
jgi:hypothetical protein